MNGFGVEAEFFRKFPLRKIFPNNRYDVVNISNEWVESPLLNGFA
jgi:hypothetical protein